ncbi:MAG: RNA methyltransferase [Anaerolineales bacterium]|nr:RNA methyltransferase [Anaerolineales bacterium]
MTGPITSLQNPRVKAVVRLRDRRHRDREGQMLVEGHDELRLALAGGVRPLTLFHCPAFTRAADAELLTRVAALGAEIVEVAPPVFEKMAYRDNPDGWLAVAPVVGHTLDGLRLGDRPLLLAVEAVEKPGNLGALLRTADAAGVTAVIVCDPATDAHNPNVVRSSRGTLFTVPVVAASTADTLTWLRAHGIAIVAATPAAARDYTAADLSGPVAIAVGAEDTGLTAAWLGQADLAVRIPMVGQVNSLNVSAAAALLVYEAVRQRSTRPPAP